MITDFYLLICLCTFSLTIQCCKPIHYKIYIYTYMYSTHLHMKQNPISFIDYRNIWKLPYLCKCHVLILPCFIWNLCKRKWRKAMCWTVSPEWLIRLLYWKESTICAPASSVIHCLYDFPPSELRWVKTWAALQPGSVGQFISITQIRLEADSCSASSPLAQSTVIYLHSNYVNVYSLC